MILESLQELPREAFVEAGSRITEPLLHEAKATSDKMGRLLRDLMLGSTKVLMDTRVMIE